MFDYRIRYAKLNNLKYLSHLDFIKMMERAIRRAQLPLTFSEGFHPHPKISFGPALAVGIESTAEFMDMQLASELSTEAIMERLNQALPQGLRIQQVKRIHQSVKTLNALINRASYHLLVSVDSQLINEAVQQLNGLLATTELNVLRVNKDGQKIVNIRPWLHTLTIKELSKNQLTIDSQGEIGSGGNLRPEDIIRSIKVPVNIETITRTRLWFEEKGATLDPMDFCERRGEASNE